MTNLHERYRATRALTERLCEPLETEDYVVQPRAEVSPPKWHLAHTTWFFETFLLSHIPSYTAYNSNFPRLFNSYYKTQGEHWIQGERGQLSRPTVKEIFRYRHHVDAAINDNADRFDPEMLKILETGIHHEQQHQELLLMDIKAILVINPEMPAYLNTPVAPSDQIPLAYLPIEGGIHRFGVNREDGFSFCNETPNHQRLLNDFSLANRPVTNGEYLAFIEDGGYSEPFLWKSDGWNWLQASGVRWPLYRHKEGWHKESWHNESGHKGSGEWREYTLHGDMPLELHAPVCHLSWYEADAYACWAKARLPDEFELELAIDRQHAHPAAGNNDFFRHDTLTPRLDAHHQPAPVGGFYSLAGNLWEWTASPYVSYPKYQRPAGAFGEYNQKFMANQMVLRGGCIATSGDHFRATYRNFFFPHQRWAFTGLRLARDV